MAHAPAGEADQTGAGALRVLELLGVIVTPFATLTGLLYYFGWVRTNAIAGYFGIDANLLAYSSQDYLLRSAGVAFRPCAALVAATGAALVAYRIVCFIDGPGRWHRRVLLIDVALVALLLIAAGAAVLFGWQRTPVPLSAAAQIIAGAVLLEIVAIRWQGDEVATAERTLRRVAVGGAVVVGLFWSFAIYAQRSGERVAAAIAVSPARLPGAVVLSHTDLGLTGPGVTMTKGPDGAAFPYRYTGLRLFIYRDHRWFLLPVVWRADAAAIILTDSAEIRVELRPLPAG